MDNETQKDVLPPNIYETHIETIVMDQQIFLWSEFSSLSDEI